MRTEQSTTTTLLEAVLAVPGVAGLEPGVATTLRALDARLRRTGADLARYGLVVDPASGAVTVEISLDGPRPVRSVVEEVQRAVRAALAPTGPADRLVLVRVQSLHR